MNRNSVIYFVLGLVLVALAQPADAQQRTKIPKIGFLSLASPSTNVARRDVFQQGLRELGYVEGKNIVVEQRFADGKFDRLSALAAELVRLKVDIILTAGASPTRAAKAATSTIPIVMMNDPDPVADGFVARLARPGGNITGLSTFAPELGGKRLEILSEVVPKLANVAIFGNSRFPSNAPVMRQMDLVARVLKVQLQYLEVLEPKDIGTAFQVAIKGRADSVATLPSAILSSQRSQMAELAVKNRLPAIYHHSRFVEAGGLMTYGVNFADLDRRAATYVDKILKGAKPADLPVEQPKKFEFIVNLKAAKQIGLTIPPNVLVRADKVIR